MGENRVVESTLPRWALVTVEVDHLLLAGIHGSISGWDRYPAAPARYRIPCGMLANHERWWGDLPGRYHRADRTKIVVPGDWRAPGSGVRSIRLGVTGILRS